jgi:hypothetical protein
MTVTRRLRRSLAIAVCPDSTLPNVHFEFKVLPRRPLGL